MFITPICKLRKFAESKTYVWIGMAACKVIKQFSNSGLALDGRCHFFNCIAIFQVLFYIIFKNNNNKQTQKKKKKKKK
jgi:hypothetical protein